MNRPQGYRYYHFMSMMAVMCILVANTIAVKIITIGNFVLPAGIIVFPLSYIFGDVMVEIYGYEKARSVIWISFLCLALMTGFYFISTELTPAPFWDNQEGYAKIFGIVPRIALASFVAFLVGAFLNAYVMSYMKVKTNGKHLWARTITSTIVGEGTDSIVFNSIAFYGVFPNTALWQIMLSGFILKTAYEVIATPLTYLFVAWLKKAEHEDKFDNNIDYNPFIIK